MYVHLGPFFDVGEPRFSWFTPLSASFNCSLKNCFCQTVMTCNMTIPLKLSACHYLQETFLFSCEFFHFLSHIIICFPISMDIIMSFNSLLSTYRQVETTSIRCQKITGTCTTRPWLRATFTVTTIHPYGPSLWTTRLPVNTAHSLHALLTAILDYGK